MFHPPAWRVLNGGEVRMGERFRVTNFVVFATFFFKSRGNGISRTLPAPC